MNVNVLCYSNHIHVCKQMVTHFHNVFEYIFSIILQFIVCLFMRETFLRFIFFSLTLHLKF